MSAFLETSQFDSKSEAQAPQADHDILVDGHVHLHACFDEKAFLNSAHQNFEKELQGITAHGNGIGVLMFADTQPASSLAILLSKAHANRLPDWTFDESYDAASIVASYRGQPKLILMAGRQIHTAEGLEILALATRASFADRQPFYETLRAVVESDAISVIPWGFGKWSFQRGMLIAELLRDIGNTNGIEKHDVFLGDNGGRTAWLGRPSLFDLANTAGVRILSGTDPLPFASHARRAGSFGIALRGRFDYRRPIAALKSLLATSSSQPRQYGHLQPLGPFLANQLKMQIHKRIHSPT